MEDNVSPRSRRFGAQFIITVVLVLIAAFVGWKIARTMQVDKPLEANRDANRELQLGMPAVTVPEITKLADKFKDANDDYLADAPPDAKDLIDPPTLVFCYVGQEDTEKYQADWKPFCDHLSKVTGKPVEYLAAKSSDEQIKAMEEGKLQVTGLNTGAVPLAVNVAGFIPVCRVPTNEDKGTHIEVIVPASSSITKLNDLKGHELTLTEPNSNSGYKGPMVLLRGQYSLEPERDYVIRMSGSHDQSIEGIANGDYQSAAVSADMLYRAEQMGVIKKEGFKSIYKSENFPSAAVGYVYNLKPELAAKVKEALMTFDIKGTPLEQDFGTTTQTKFVPVNYKDDWAVIRRIDEECSRLRPGKSG
jgi:phosphonate transport system substrate-binding protein